MRRTILLVVFSLLACTLVQAEVNRIGGGRSDRHHDRGSSRPRVTITFGFGQPCWPAPQYMSGYFPGAPSYGYPTGYDYGGGFGYGQPCPNPAGYGGGYGYGGANAAYAKAYRQRMEQLECQRRYQIEEAARQAGRRAADQQFNYGGYGY